MDGDDDHRDSQTAPVTTTKLTALDKTVEDLVAEALRKRKPEHRPASSKPSKRPKQRAATGPQDMALICHNCGGRGHKRHACPSPCLQVELPSPPLPLLPSPPQAVGTAGGPPTNGALCGSWQAAGAAGSYASPGPMAGSSRELELQVQLAQLQLQLQQQQRWTPSGPVPMAPGQPGPTHWQSVGQEAPCGHRSPLRLAMSPWGLAPFTDLSELGQLQSSSPGLFAPVGDSWVAASLALVNRALCDSTLALGKSPAIHVQSQIDLASPPNLGSAPVALGALGTPPSPCSWGPPL
jgi:hypothetical protein